MGIESDIEDLKAAFEAFIEIRIQEEVDARMENEHIPEEQRWDIMVEIKQKYERVLVRL